MRLSRLLRNSVWAMALALSAQAPQPPAKDAPAADAKATEAKGMAPRGTPANYQAQVQVGKLTIGAEFMRHGIPTASNQLNSDDYVVVEAGFFGAPGAKATLSVNDF